MNEKPFVSVLMPAYNSEKFIGIAIKSVLDSTYTNFELIITDDNSTDNTYKIAKSFQEKDARVKVFLNDKNYGDYPNSHLIGIELCHIDDKGEMTKDTWRAAIGLCIYI